MYSYRTRLASINVLLWLAVFSVASPAQDASANRLGHAAQLLAAGQLDQAESELQIVLHASPREYRALDLLGVVRVMQHREPEAAALFERAIQRNPDFASARAHLGLVYMQAGGDQQAVPELEAALRLDPGRRDASDALVHIFRRDAEQAGRSGNPKLSLGLLIQARKLAPENPDVQFEFASAAFQMSLLQDAADGFQATLAQRKDDALAVYGLGRAYGGLGKLEEAHQQFVRYIALRPDDPAGYCSLGMTLVALDRPAEARAPFAKSLMLAPEQTEAYLQLGLLELHARNWGTATANLQHVVDRDSRNARALSALGRIKFEQKQYQDAADLLEQAIQSDSSLEEAHYYVGLTYGRLGKKAESYDELQKATQLQREDVEKRRALWNRLDLPPASREK